MNAQKVVGMLKGGGYAGGRGCGAAAASCWQLPAHATRHPPSSPHLAGSNLKFDQHLQREPLLS